MHEDTTSPFLVLSQPHTREDWQKATISQSCRGVDWNYFHQSHLSSVSVFPTMDSVQVVGAASLSWKNAANPLLKLKSPDISVGQFIVFGGEA
jgi:hypothetical protein